MTLGVNALTIVLALFAACANAAASVLMRRAATEAPDGGETAPVARAGRRAIRRRTGAGRAAEAAPPPE